MYSLQPFLLGGREKAEIGPVVGMAWTMIKSAVFLFWSGISVAVEDLKLGSIKLDGLG